MSECAEHKQETQTYLAFRDLHAPLGAMAARNEVWCVVKTITTCLYVNVNAISPGTQKLGGSSPSQLSLLQPVDVGDHKMESIRWHGCLVQLFASGLSESAFEWLFRKSVCVWGFLFPSRAASLYPKPLRNPLPLPLRCLMPEASSSVCV